MYRHAYDWNIGHKLPIFNQISINLINKFNISLILAIIRPLLLLLLQIYKKLIICHEQTLLDQNVGTKDINQDKYFPTSAINYFYRRKLRKNSWRKNCLKIYNTSCSVTDTINIRVS